MKISNRNGLIVKVGSGILFLLFGAAVFIYSEEDHRQQDARPQDQQGQKDQRQQQQENKGQQEQGRQEHEQAQGQQKEQQAQQHRPEQKAQDQQKQQAQQHRPEQKTQDQQKQRQQVQNQEKQQPQTQGIKQQQAPGNHNRQQTSGLHKGQPAKSPQEHVQTPSAKSGLQKQQAKPIANQPQPQAKSVEKRQAASQPAQRVQQSEQHGVWQQHRAGNWQSEHRTWEQRGGYSGFRIPQDHYHGHFGRYHSFRLYSLQMEVYGGYPRFQYNGYWFDVLDPWPESWSDNWYENDNVYIIYSNDGYYLYNRSYPGTGIAISVSMD